MLLVVVVVVVGGMLIVSVKIFSGSDEHRENYVEGMVVVMVSAEIVHMSDEYRELRMPRGWCW